MDIRQNTTNSKIRVGMVSLAFYSAYSGAGMQAWRLCQKLARMGIVIHVITEISDKSIKRETLGEISVYRLPKRGHGRTGALWFAVKIICYLLKNRKNYNLLHIHGAYWYSQAAVLAGKLSRKKIIVKMSLLGDDDLLSIRNKQLFGWLGFRILGMADKIISTSSELSDSYRKSGLSLEKLAEIPNGVDTQQFFPATPDEKLKIRQDLGLPPDGTFVTFVGEIYHRKGVDILVKAWGEVTREFPSARLLLIGPNGDNPEDDYVRSLHQQVNDLNLTDKVLFTGQVNNINRYLKASDVFAFPSRREGMPNAVVEAMACGLPCVVMETSCVTDIITDGVNGLIFDAEDSQQLARYIIQLLKEPSLRYQLGEEARKTAQTSFSLDSVAGRYLELYIQLLG